MMEDEIEEEQDNVRVAVRIRPFLPHEQESEDSSSSVIRCWLENTVIVGSSTSNSPSRFTFDHVFDAKTNQEFLFQETVLPLLERCLEGYNGTVLAYGQTGSGKTHTIVGDIDDDHHHEDNTQQAGILPRAFQAIFQYIQQQAPSNNNTFIVRLSFLEIYGELIRDLLAPSTNPKLQIRDFGNDEPVVVGATHHVIQSSAQAMRLLRQGMLKRVTGSTAMNATSSRSHAILTLHIEQQQQQTSTTSSNHNDESSYTQIKRSKFNFVDLAGSERIKRTQAEGQRRKEGIDINKGLLVLGNVISALGDPTKIGRTFVPYRDSKLTRLLKGSLGGNHKTLMIACVSPSSTSLEESLNCLRYANRAKNIQNNAVVNVDPTSQILGPLRDKVQKLVSDLLFMHHHHQNEETNVKLHFSIQELQDMMLPEKGGAVSKKSSSTTSKPRVSIVSPTNEDDDDDDDNNNNMATELAQTREELRQSQRNHDRAEEELFTVKAEKEMYRLQLSVQDSSNSAAPSTTTTIEHVFLERAKTYEQEIGRLREALTRAERKLATKREYSAGDFQRALDEDRRKIDLIKGISTEAQFEAEQLDKEKETASLTRKYLREAGHEESGNMGGNENGDERLSDDIKRDIQERENLQADLFDLTRSIEAKEDLIDQLKLSQEKYSNMREFYEEKLQDMKRVLDEKESEREILLQELQDTKHDDKVLDSLKNKLKEKEKHIESLKRKQRELSELTKVSSKNDIEIDRLQSDVLTMKRRKVELQKQLGQERKDHAIEIKRLQKEAAVKERELNKQKNISSKMEIDAKKANQVAKARLEELGTLRQKYKESEKRIRMLSVKRGVMEKAGLDPVMVGKRNPSNKNDKIEEKAIEKLHSYFDAKVVDFARKEALVDKLAEEWEEHFQISQELEEARDHVNPDSAHLDSLQIQLDFKEDRIRQIARGISKENGKSPSTSSKNSNLSDAIFSDSEVQSICRGLGQENSSLIMAKVLFGMVVKERRRVGALARSSSLLDTKLQVAEKNSREKSDALRNYMEEFQKEKNTLIQSHQEHILSLMDLVRENDSSDDSSRKQELEYLADERIRALTAQVETYKSELETAEMELIRLGEIENEIHKIRKDSRSAQKNLRGALSSMRSLHQLVTRKTETLDPALSKEIISIIDDGLSFGTDNMEIRVSPKLRRQSIQLDPFSDEAIMIDDSEVEEVPAWANDIMKDLSIIAEGNIPPSLSALASDIESTPPPSTNKSGEDTSVFDRLNDPSTFTGTQKKALKSRKPKKERAHNKERSGPEVRRVMAENIAESLNKISVPDPQTQDDQDFEEDGEKQYLTVFERLMSPSQYTGTQREKVQKSKSKAEKIQNEVAERILDDILTDNVDNHDISVDHTLSLERAEEYARQDVFERLQKTTTQSYAVKYHGPDTTSGESRLQTAATSGSPTRTKSFHDADSRQPSRENTSLNVERQTTSKYTNVFERLQNTTTEAYAKKTRKDN